MLCCISFSIHQDLQLGSLWAFLPTTQSPHSGLLKKKVKSLVLFILFLIFYLIKLVSALCSSPRPRLFVSLQFSMSPCYPVCFSCLWPVHSVPYSFYYHFLMFLFISIDDCLLLSVGPGPQLFSCPLLWVESGLVPYLISVICTCRPQGSTAWMSPEHVPVYLTVTVYTLIKDVFFPAYQ